MKEYAKIVVWHAVNLGWSLYIAVITAVQPDRDIAIL